MYKNGDACPVCEEGTLTSSKIIATFEYKGNSLDIPDYLIWECGECKERFVDHKTSKEGGRKVRDFHRMVDGLLTANEIKRIRKFKLCLSQDDASVLLGGGAKSFARYENSEVIQSEIMDNLLRVIDDRPYVIDSIKNKHMPKRVISTTQVYRTQQDRLVGTYDK